MSRIFEALQQAKSDMPSAPEALSAPTLPPEPVRELNGVLALDQVSTFSIKTLPEYRVVTVTDENSLGAEKIRVLSARLRTLQQKRQLKKILVTSSISAEGKSVLSTNLAVTLAMRGRKKTLLISGDLRRPAVARMLGTTELPGLTDWWREGNSISDYLRRAEGLSLWLLPSGGEIEQPLEILQSERLSKLMAQLGEWFDWIIVDAPPLSPMADSAIWVNLVDGVLVIARTTRAPRRLLQKSLDSVEKTKLLGIVLNGAAEVEGHYLNYYRKYQRTSPRSDGPSAGSEPGHVPKS